MGSLQDQALLLLLPPGQEGCAGGVLEDLADALVRLGGAFEVFLCADLLTDVLGLCTDRCQRADLLHSVMLKMLGGVIPARASPASAKSCAAPR